jgi:glycosyltransferase involved in cell wall biosynthesis
VVDFIPFSMSARAENLAKAKVLLVPSVKEWYGLVVLEANAFNTPVIGYDVPWLRDSIEDWKNWWLVKDGDWEEMSRKIFLIEDDSFDLLEWNSVTWEGKVTKMEEELLNLHA